MSHDVWKGDLFPGSPLATVDRTPADHREMVLASLGPIDGLCIGIPLGFGAGILLSFVAFTFLEWWVNRETSSG